MKLNNEIPVKHEPEVLVAGAGCAGVAAAIAAAEQGASVLLVESAGYPGGFNTAVGGPGLDGMFDNVTAEALSSSRVTGTALGMGEAAGAAAAIAVNEKVERMAELPHSDLRSVLAKRQVIFAH